MSGASIETTLELWAASLREVKARIRPLFRQDRVAASAGLFLDGLLGEERRKTGWMRAEAAGDPGPWRQQAILGRGRWDAEGAAQLRSVLDLLGDEAAGDRPGRGLLLERLLEVMLIQALRNTPAGPENGRQSLLAGLADPQIASALRAIHADVGKNWTVGQLAAICGMSRSVFAERFSRVIGVPPIDYLLRWRMALAKDALRSGRKRLTEVAFNSGYSSVSAFSTAFTRTVGCPPSHYATRNWFSPVLSSARGG